VKDLPAKTVIQAATRLRSTIRREPAGTVPPDPRGPQTFEEVADALLDGDITFDEAREQLLTLAAAEWDIPLVPDALERKVLDVVCSLTLRALQFVASRLIP